jgi:hypothetical protein
MSVLTRAADALRELEEELTRRKVGEGDDSAEVAERIRAVRNLLSREDARWVGTAEAKRLLGLGSENTVEAWARAGRLRSRVLPNGRIQVLLDDVLHRREAAEGVSAFGGDFLTEDELEELHRSRPGTLPWERAPAAQVG